MTTGHHLSSEKQHPHLRFRIVDVQSLWDVLLANSKQLTSKLEVVLGLVE